MVVGWHHWRKVSRLDDREDYVRPLAWSRALRRSQARWWSRMKGLDPEAAATLDALAKLPVAQRRVLLLSHLTSLPLEGIAREVGVSRSIAERDLQTATSQFAVHRVRRVPRHPARARGAAAAGRGRALAAPLDHHPGRLGPPPLAHHLRRGRRGRRRRWSPARSSPTPPASARAWTPRASSRASSPKHHRRRRSRRPGRPAADARVAARPPTRSAASLDGAWTQGQTAGNTDGRRPGLHLPGRAVRRPRGLGGAGAHLQAGRQRRGQPSVSTSRSPPTRTPARRPTAPPPAGTPGACRPGSSCCPPSRSSGVGDDAMLFVLRDWTDPTSAQVVGVARTGGVTTTTSLTRAGDGHPDPSRPSAALLAAAVDDLCGLPGGGECADAPQAQDGRPDGDRPRPGDAQRGRPAAGARRSTLPWVGTEPGAADDQPRGHPLRRGRLRAVQPQRRPARS